MGTRERKEEDGHVFLREATGLRKNVSFIDAISMNIGVMSMGPTLATIGFTFVLLPRIAGVNLVLGSIISAILVLPLLTVYTMLGRRLSRTGGDYVWISRAFGGAVGAPAAFTGFIITTMAFSAFTLLSIVFAIGSIGVFFGNQSFLGLALPGSVEGAAPTFQFIVAIVIFLVLLAINITNSRVGYRMVTVMTSFSILVLLISMLVILSGGHQGVVNYMNSLGDANVTYSKVASSYSGPNFDLAATLFLLPFFAIFVYPYLNNPPAVGSELRTGNATRWNGPVAVAVVAVILTSAFGVMYAVGGLGFINAALANPTLVFNYSFNFFTLAMGMSGNQALSLVIGLGWIVSWMVVLQVNMLAIPRYLLSMAMDRFLPSQLAYVHPRFGTPVVGLLAYAIPTMVVLGFATYLYDTTVSLFGAVVATMIYFVLLGAAALVYASRERNSSSKLYLVIAGVLTIAIFGYVTWQFFAYQSVWGGNPLAYGFDLVGLVFAIVVYAVSKSYNSRKGVDIGLAFKEIPPE